jgi:hypothetical protein
MGASARARCVLHFDPRVQQCTTRRAARALVTVHVLRGLLPPPAGSASADGTSDGTSSAGRDGARGRGDGGAVRRRAECTWLSPASYSASFPFRSAHCFGVSLRARGCCGFRFKLCGAAQRYLLSKWLVWTAPSAPRSSSSATDEEWPYFAAQCSGVALHGRRRRGLGAAHSTADSPPAQTAHPMP